MLIHPHTASMLLLLVFDYNLPMELSFGEAVVVQSNGRKHQSILRSVIVTVEEQNEHILDAALVILNIE